MLMWSMPATIEEGTRTYRFTRVPSENLAAVLFMYRDMAVEFDGIAHIQPLYLPGVAKVEPVVRLLMLETIHDGLHMASHIICASAAAV